ncbi:hypothetical protein HUT18_05530 [Streptomyces sp. NA04227]|uniref:hypothetical protein n=1 Tax=Streptomyces sp. NA04227 TaxID=2742136 RepID=UPI00159008B8|nr:hypothetical protein [Streptomyces sp. NA04227]QKW05932.1 hypothetical protein HUT18_05530 [Streptomyces sp. NA04227]
MADDEAEVAHGFPHLETVRRAITALHRRLGQDPLRAYGCSVPPVDVAFDDTEDPHLGSQRIAAALVHHYRLPDARMIVSFREMRHAALVELAAGPEYFIELNSRFRHHRRDIGAALAHEITHVLLHRLDLTFPGTRDNEILTDTAATYLGTGWLLLDAFRQDALTSQKLGYLTPEEYGYVLAKRALLLGGGDLASGSAGPSGSGGSSGSGAVSPGEDVTPWFTSPQAAPAYAQGMALARRDVRRAPLTTAGWADRRRYAKDRRLAVEGGTAARPNSPATAGISRISDMTGISGIAGISGRNGRRPPGYTFTASDHPSDPLSVSFACPTCFQRIRVPVRGRVRARCGLCKSVLDCET